MTKGEKIVVKLAYMPRGDVPRHDNDTLYYTREKPQRGGPMEA